MITPLDYAYLEIDIDYSPKFILLRNKRLISLQVFTQMAHI
jgi:hypothetical protein